jgi:hypothetical protein
MTTCLGIDPSSVRIAVGALTDTGDIGHHVQIIPDGHKGARRLHLIRRVMLDSLRAYGRPEVVLHQIAGVLLEVAQEAFPCAVVIDMPTQVWKKWSVGPGNCSHSEYLAHAQGLGMEGKDLDVAAALCMAQAGFEAWATRTESAAA